MFFSVVSVVLGALLKHGYCHLWPNNSITIFCSLLVLIKWIRGFHTQHTQLFTGEGRSCLGKVFLNPHCMSLKPFICLLTCTFYHFKDIYASLPFLKKFIKTWLFSILPTNANLLYVTTLWSKKEEPSEKKFWRTKSSCECTLYRKPLCLQWQPNIWAVRFAKACRDEGLTDNTHKRHKHGPKWPQWFCRPIFIENYTNLKVVNEAL